MKLNTSCNQPFLEIQKLEEYAKWFIYHWLLNYYKENVHIENANIPWEDWSFL